MEKLTPDLSYPIMTWDEYQAYLKILPLIHRPGRISGFVNVQSILNGKVIYNLVRYEIHT